tara:strand:- start:2936 stop:3277 length:342 start_codon:yes stop_codon:yes gene_type:complete
MTKETIFSKIISGEITCKEVYRDDLCLAFHDVNPQAPVHILIIPLKAIESLNSIEEEDTEILGHLLKISTKIAKQEGLDSWRTVINTGEKAGQTVFHLHIHIIGGRNLLWPPG